MTDHDTSESTDDADHKIGATFRRLRQDRGMSLRELADMLTKRLREEDKLFRYGGEEFVVLADGLPHRAALGLAERLRRVIAEESGKLKSGRITVSIGVATAPEDGGALVDLFVAADKRLYQAKDNGRDRVIGQPDPDGGAGAE